MPEADHAERIAERRRALESRCRELLSLEGELVLEIGSGHGHFLTAYGKAHPAQFCLGVDLSLDRVERAERKSQRAGLTNVHFFRADIADFFAVLPSRVRFAAVIVLFPDPWPKRRHHKNRLLGPEFLRDLATRTHPGARLYFRTDHTEYYESARKATQRVGEWRVLETPWLFETETVFSARAPRHHSLVAERVQKD